MMNDNWQPVTLYSSEQLLINTVNGHVYQVMVATIGEEPSTGYPVLYVLDGNAYFAVAAQMARTLYERPNQSAKKSVMIVGIGYAQTQSFHRSARAKDYTPPSAFYHDDGSGYEYGGAEQFYQIIQDKIIPAVGQRWQINESRQGIFGHSYGGLFGLYTLIHHPESFEFYYLASPSLWWNQAQIIKDLPSLSPMALDGFVHQIALSVGELEDGKRRFDFDTSQQLPLDQADVLSLYHYLQSRTHDTQVHYHHHVGHNHGMNAYPSIARAVDLFYQACLASTQC